MEVNGVKLALTADDTDDGDAGRRSRGLAIAALVNITKNKLGYKVPAQSGSGSYVVNIDDDEPFCSCPDFELRQLPCKHIYSVEFLIQREERPDGTTIETKSVKVKYTQDWANYDKAQMNEGDDFLVLLRELCDTVEQPEYSFGRPRLPLSDTLFGMAVKVYSLMSGRRAMSDIRSAEAKGLLEKAPSFASVARYMENPEMSDLLISLIRKSALPLASVETDFAPDSSGFSSKSYVRWFDKKWGKEVREAKWAKCHIMTGVKTNIVTDCAVTSEAGNDSPYLIPFLNTTAEYFNINEVSADKAYLSKPNLWAIHDVGATPYIPFKKNSVAHNPKQKRDGLWIKMFHYFNYNRSDFLAHYHKRSNVESTFSMVKAKFGASVKSKTDTAMVNEVLTKILCHNIVVLIAAMYELGVAPVFTGHLPIDREMAALTGSGPEIQSRMVW